MGWLARNGEILWKYLDCIGDPVVEHRNIPGNEGEPIGYRELAWNGEPSMELNEISGKIIGSAIKVHKALGPGLLENAYEGCLVYELAQNGLKRETQLELPVVCEGVRIKTGYRLDVLVEKSVIVELKTVEKIIPIHQAQMLSYLKMSRLKLGLILNFNTMILRNGIKRMVNNF